MRKKLFLTVALISSLIFTSACSEPKMPGSWIILDTGTPDAFFSVNFVNDKVGFLNASTDRSYVPLGVDANTNANSNQNANQNSASKNDNSPTANANGKKKVDPLKANDGFEVLQTTDGGETWNQLPEQFKYKIRSVWFVDPQNGWALTIDRDILRTTDGAKTWTTQRKAGKVKLKITANRRTPEIEQPEQIERLHFVDVNHGWAWGGGVKNEYSEQPGIFLTTIDGGQNWNEIKYPFEQNVYSAFFLDAQRAWANTAEGGFYKTTDGGVTWTKYQSKTPELTFDSIFFLDDNHGWVAGHSGKLAKTADGVPHLLSMSATPIPRSLALALHGDLDCSFLTERPAGRAPAAAAVCIGADERRAAYGRLREAVAEGRQAFVVCPVRESARRDDAVTAVAQHARLCRELRPARVGLLHGALGGDAKEQTLRAFARGALDVLVATTVVELGIDVANATVMIIEEADRFGVAQLHQLRGRVGRGRWPGICFLCAGGAALSDEARARLALVAGNADGFSLAEADLGQRGAGDLFGTRQAGAPPAELGHIEEVAALLPIARREAAALLAADPALAAAEHALLARAVRDRLETLFAGDAG